MVFDHSNDLVFRLVVAVANVAVSKSIEVMMDEVVLRWSARGPCGPVADRSP